MEQELQNECNKILDQDNVIEEDKIELVEKFVADFLGERARDVDLERVVLDILWRHREATYSVKRRATEGETVDNSGINEVAERRREEHEVASNIAALKIDNETDSSIHNAGTMTSSEWTSVDAYDTMNPFDILRSVLGSSDLDEDISKALEKNGFDIQRVLEIMKDNMESIQQEQFQDHEQDEQPNHADDESVSDSIGDSIYLDNAQNEHSKVLCKYFVQYGECLRADCFYSHDLSSRICKFWLQGSCLAGDECAFLHEIPSNLLEATLEPAAEPTYSTIRPFDLTKEDDFPMIGAKKSKKGISGKPASQKPTSAWAANPLIHSSSNSSVSGGWNSTTNRSWNPSSKSFQPTWSSSNNLSDNKNAQDLVSSKIGDQKKLSLLVRKSVDILRPKHIPWEDTEFLSNSEYMVLRKSAARHANLRNRYLQLGADSWHTNDAEAAKLYSLRGQSHNEKMMADYEAASDLIFSQRKEPSAEVYIDLHGTDLSDVGSRLQVLETLESENQDHPGPVYLISGHGRYHDTKRGAEDKLTKTVKTYLDKKGYRWTEFNTAEKRFGKLIGVDIYSHY